MRWMFRLIFDASFKHASDNDRVGEDEKVVQTRGCYASRPGAVSTKRATKHRNATCRKSQNSGM